MGYDPLSPISLARVNVLCVPVGKTTAQRFDEQIKALCAFNIVPLRNSSNPSKFSTYRDGRVLLNISKYLYQDGSDQATWLDPNAKPQIVIGLVDGETLPDENTEQWLSASLDKLDQTTVSLNERAAGSLIVLGGRQIPVSNHSYFVDLDGDGPSLSDAVQEIVGRFQAQLEDHAKDLEETLLASVRDGGDRSSPAPSANDRTIEQARSPPNRANSPAIGHAQNGLSTDEHNEASARHAALRGLLNLQAGQWPEALRYLSESATVARNNMIHLWYGRALEGLYVCMLLFAWAHLDFNVPQVCYPSSDKRAPIYGSPSMSAICAANRSATDSLSTGRSISSAHTLTLLTPYLLSTIINQYERAAGMLQDGVYFRMLCQARVRWGALLLTMKKHGGVLHDEALESLVEGSDSGLAKKKSSSSTTSLILHVKALTKMFVDAALEAQSRLSVQQAAPLQISIATNLSLLGVERKQAFYLKEFLRRLGPALIEARRIGAAEVGIHPSASMPPLNVSSNGSIGMAQVNLGGLLETTCEIYGLPKSRSDLTELQTSRDRLQSALHLWSAAHQAGDIMMKIDILRLCVEVSDAIPDLQCSLFFMTRLLQISIGKPILYGSAEGPPPLISSDDQSQILQSVRKTVKTAVRYGMSDIRASYWDKCLVRLIEVSDDPSSNRLMPRTARDLSLAAGTNNEANKDPFIFNPFTRNRGRAGQSVLVVGEQARFDVVLQNPLSIEVEIEDITLIAEGCEFQPNHHSIILGPLCSQTFVLSGNARLPGDLLVTGCQATIRGCHPEDFLIVTGDWKPIQVTKRMAGSTAVESSDDMGLPEIKQLSLKVIAPVPKLSVVSTSLLQQSLMLLEGEKTTFNMIIQNDSDLDTDLVLVTFEDSVTRRLEEALNNKDLPPADLFEIQNQIASRSVIRLADTSKSISSLEIPARKRIELTFELIGRPGLTDIAVLIDYAFIGIPRQDIEGIFYTRQLRHTVATTVNGSIDIPRCSVLPIEGNISSAFQDNFEPDEHLPKGSFGGKEGNRCMLLLDVRNIWPHPLRVKFQACQSSPEQTPESDRWQDAFEAVETLQPGQMARILLLAPRILVTNPYAPIPSLDTKRQFVVSASKMTIEAEAASRELFWYRERLLKFLRATWQEQNGNRSGQVDMRKGVRLNSRMIDALRMDLVELSFSLRVIESSIEESSRKQSPVDRVGPSQYSLRRNMFASLITTVHNHSTEEQRLLIRLQPSLHNQPHNIALDLAKRFAWTGVLQQALHPALQPNEARELELGIIALAEGEYEINATAEEIKSRVARVENTALEVGSGTERRLWHARRPCLIDVVDHIPTSSNM